MAGERAGVGAAARLDLAGAGDAGFSHDCVWARGKRGFGCLARPSSEKIAHQGQVIPKRQVMCGVYPEDPELGAGGGRRPVPAQPAPGGAQQETPAGGGSPHDQPQCPDGRIHNSDTCRPRTATPGHSGHPLHPVTSLPHRPVLEEPTRARGSWAGRGPGALSSPPQASEARPGPGPGRKEARNWMRD